MPRCFRAFGIPLLLWAVLWAVPGAAQDASLDLRRDTSPRITSNLDGSLGSVTPTPEMWFYEQERARLDDPKMAIRHRAEVKAQQRRDRLASQKWYGISNSRPTVSSTPIFGGYSPYWGSNTYNPYRWRPPGPPVVVLRSGDRPY